MDLTPPDSPVARAAADLAAEASEPFLLNHVNRTYWFGKTIVTADLDSEAAYVACMLHDIGLTDRHRSDRSFELVSADVAAHFLEARGWDADRIRLVEQGITQHTNIGTNEDPVELLVQAGAAFDVIGLPMGAIPEDTVHTIEAAFPRMGFRENMLSAFFREIHEQPEGVFAQLEEKLAFSQRVKSRPS